MAKDEIISLKLKNGDIEIRLIVDGKEHYYAIGAKGLKKLLESQ
jgi:hypothetical protein